MRHLKVTIQRTVLFTGTVSVAVPDAWDDTRAEEQIRRLVPRMVADEEIDFRETELDSGIQLAPASKSDEDPTIVFDVSGRPVRWNVPCNEPEPADWIEWRGGRWATNGHVIVPEDGGLYPRGPVDWRRGLETTDLERSVASVEWTLLSAGRILGEGTSAVRHTYTRPDGAPVVLSRRYAADIPTKAVLRQAGGHEGVVEVSVAGRVVLYVMPLRMTVSDVARAQEAMASRAAARTT